MRCGTKCFYVNIEQDKKSVQLPVFARSPAGARKIVREEYGNRVEISTVKKRGTRTLSN